MPDPRRWSRVLIVLAACARQPPRAPAPTGWWCAVWQEPGRSWLDGGACLRGERACADEAGARRADGLAVSPCRARPIAWCFTVDDVVQCLPDELLCEDVRDSAFADDADTDVTPCAASP